eukprot:3158724-Amphidinium_carterae.2
MDMISAVNVNHPSGAGWFPIPSRYAQSDFGIGCHSVNHAGGGAGWLPRSCVSVLSFGGGA